MLKLRFHNSGSAYLLTYVVYKMTKQYFFVTLVTNVLKFKCSDFPTCTYLLVNNIDKDCCQFVSKLSKYTFCLTHSVQYCAI